MFRVDIKKTQPTLTEKEPMTSGSRNVYVAEFTFSEEWSVLQRTAVFRAGDVTINILLDDANKCFIPWEVLVDPGKTLQVGAFGVLDENTILPTIWVTVDNILQGVTTGVEPSEPTPDVYQQILAKLNSISSGGSSSPDTPSPVDGSIPVKHLSAIDYASLSYEERNKDILYIVSRPFTFNELSWSEIQALSKSGELSVLYSVGDSKTIKIGGTFNGVTVPDQEIELVIAGLDHNADLETPGEHCIHFLLGKKDGKPIYIAGTPMYTQGSTNAGGWEASVARLRLNDTSDGLQKILPGDLFKVMRSVRKYTDNVANGNANIKASVTYTDDYISVLSPYEGFSTVGGANIFEADYQKQYEIFEKFHTDSWFKSFASIGENSQNFMWTRSPDTTASTNWIGIHNGSPGSLTGYVPAAVPILLFV